MVSVLLSLALVASAPEVPVSNDAHVQAAARDFRLALYHACRDDRVRYNEYRATGDTLLRAWVAAQEPASHRLLVVNWFENSAQAVKRNPSATLQPLPELPRFAAQSVANGNPAAEAQVFLPQLALEAKPSPFAPAAVKSSSGSVTKSLSRAISRAVTPSAKKQKSPSAKPAGAKK